MDGLGNIFLLNRQDYAIYKFDPNGKYVSRFGSVGAAAGQFDTWAHNIAVDNQSRVYVTDFSGLKVYDANGSFLESMKAYFSGDMEMRITEKNEIFVVGGNNMITKLVRNTPQSAMYSPLIDWLASRCIIPHPPLARGEPRTELRVSHVFWCRLELRFEENVNSPRKEIPNEFG